MEKPQTSFGWLAALALASAAGSVSAQTSSDSAAGPAASVASDQSQANANASETVEMSPFEVRQGRLGEAEIRQLFHGNARRLFAAGPARRLAMSPGI